MGIFLGIIGLLVLGFGTELYRREKVRRAQAPFIAYVHWRDYPCPWEVLAPREHPCPTDGFFMEMEWFDTLEAVVSSLRAHPCPDRLWLSQSDGTRVSLPYDSSLSDEQIANAIFAAIK